MCRMRLAGYKTLEGVFVLDLFMTAVFLSYDDQVYLFW